MKDTKKMPAIALGTWSWGVGAAVGDQVFGNHLNETDLKPVFDAAMKQGLNLWDTAVVYGMGASEAIPGTFARQYPGQVLLSTKFTPQIAGGETDPVTAMCDASLARLGTEVIDLYWIHNPADVEKWTPYLAKLIKSGKVKRVGVSNHNLAQIKRAEEILSQEGVHISAVQDHFSLLYRSSEKAGILDYCKEHDMDFFAYMVLGQGALSGKYDTRHPLPAGSQRAETYNPILPQLETLIAAMCKLGEKYGVGVPQVGVAYAIAKGAIPIIGVTKPSHVDDAVKAASVQLISEEVIMLEELAEATGADTKGVWENPMA